MTVEMATRFEAAWKSRRDGPHVQFQRIGPQPIAGDGTMLPDLPVTGRLTLLAARNDGKKVDPYDEKGRLWLRAYVINPNEIVESYMMRVAWDAFAQSIERFRERPRMLAHHNVTQPIGGWPEVAMSTDGVIMRGFISSARPDMQQLALDGVLDVSAGFMIDEATWNEDLEVLDVTRATLFETSLVSLPAVRSSFIEVMAGWAESGKVDGWDRGEAWTRGASALVVAEAEEEAVEVVEVVRPVEDIGFSDALVSTSRALVGTGAALAEASLTLGLALEAAGGGVGGRT